MYTESYHAHAQLHMFNASVQTVYKRYRDRYSAVISVLADRACRVGDPMVGVSRAVCCILAGGVKSALSDRQSCSVFTTVNH